MKELKYLLIVGLIFLLPVKVFATDLPSKYDLRNVNGKSYVTPFKDQGDEGLCWDFGATAHFESRVLKEKNKPYDSSATIFSEKQLAYAASAVITNGKRAYNKKECDIDIGQVDDGGDFVCAVEVMLDGLGAVSATWEEENKAAIKNNNAPLDANIVYNFNNSLYEVNSTLEYYGINYKTLSSDNKKALLSAIKEKIIQYGGGSFDTDIANDAKGIYEGQEVYLFGAYDSSSFRGSGHAMQVIGWDDDYEYKLCKRGGGYIDPDDECPNSYFTGNGVWIIKNSWEGRNIALVPYDTYHGYDIRFFTDISPRSWDNFYQLDSEFINSNSRSFFFKNNEYVTDEIINKIKVRLRGKTNNKIYYSENGDDSYVLLGEIDTHTDSLVTNGPEDYIGYYYLDLSSKSYHINKNSKFKIVDGYGNIDYDFRVYTTNISNDPSLKVKNVTFDKSKHNKSTYSFELDTHTRNIKDDKTLTYKIKDPNKNYVATSNYSYDHNAVYANLNSTKLTLHSNEFRNGTYTIETYYNNSLLASSKLTVKGSSTLPNGDVNGDGNVTKDDAKALTLYIVEGKSKYTAEQLAAGDINQDGPIKMNDVITILKGIQS